MNNRYNSICAPLVFIKPVAQALLSWTSSLRNARRHTVGVGEFVGAVWLDFFAVSELLQGRC